VQLVQQKFALGPQWPTLDPFLFCAHHDDLYPPGDASLAPAASLDGRSLGQDFSGTDGWSMYHGTRVPGFPSHPHRGFETVTHVREGWIDHADSLGAAARFGRGDTQWMTAGGGISHSEMFPLLDADGPNPLELFQIWINLPAADKMVDAHFAMFWNEHTPTVVEGRDGSRSRVTVIAGSHAGRRAPAPAPNSWAARPDNDVAILHLDLDPGSEVRLDAPADGSHRVLYVHRGAGVHLTTPSDRARGSVEEVRPSHLANRVGAATGAVVDNTTGLVVSAEESTGVLVLQGRPIAEPTLAHGPFVLNDRAGVQQAMDDYRRTGFGEWTWGRQDPDHGPDASRFARHADGRVEHPPADD